MPDETEQAMIAKAAAAARKTMEDQGVYRCYVECPFCGRGVGASLKRPDRTKLRIRGTCGEACKFMYDDPA